MIIQKMNTIMILPELFINLIKLCPGTISTLLVISKIHYNIIIEYINHLIFVCDKEKGENIEKLLYFFMNHDIVYGFANLINSTDYWLNVSHIEHLCNLNSHRILSFSFKYKNYYFMWLTIPVYFKGSGHTVLLLSVENFTKNGSIHHLNKLIIGNEYRDDMLFCFYQTLENLDLYEPVNSEIKNTIVNLFFNYARHYNLNKTYLLNFAHRKIYTFESICILLEFMDQ